MAQKRNALGRGLDALLSMDEVQTEGSSSINEIECRRLSSTRISHVMNLTKRRFRNLPTQSLK